MSDSLPGSLARRLRIEEAVSLLQDYPFVANSQMIAMMEGLGYDHKTSVDLVAYIPLAYFRVLLERKGTRFPATCVFYNQAGEVWSLLLKDQEIFTDSVDYARYDIAKGMLQEHIQGIIRRSCEFPHINGLLTDGADPLKLALEPAEFNVDGEDLVLEPEPTDGAPWWKFW